MHQDISAKAADTSAKGTPRILLLGAGGFVGSRIAAMYPTAIVLPSATVRAGGEELTEAVRALRPDVILNAAAISDIGACERDPDASYAANVTLPVTLAAATRKTGAKLVSFSSDQVYTGLSDTGPYREDIPLPPPTNVYARHKLEAEERVLAADPTAVLLRATWMYDMPLYGHKNRGNFLINTLRALAAHETLSVSDGQYRGITYVREVVLHLADAWTLPGGVYNYGSENPLSMYETTRALIAALGRPELLSLVTKSEAPARHNLWMNGEKLRRAGISFDTAEEGFRRVSADYALSL